MIVKPQCTWKSGQYFQMSSPKFTWNKGYNLEIYHKGSQVQRDHCHRYVDHRGSLSFKRITVIKRIS